MGKVIELRAFSRESENMESFKEAFDKGADHALNLIDALHAENLDESHEKITGSLIGALHIIMWCAMDCAPDRELAHMLIADATRMAEGKADDSSEES